MKIFKFSFSNQKLTTGYRIVKNVSRLLNKFLSTPVSGFKLETAG